jgi:hypothetical protein
MCIVLASEGCGRLLYDPASSGDGGAAEDGASRDAEAGDAGRQDAAPSDAASGDGGPITCSRVIPVDAVVATGISQITRARDSTTTRLVVLSAARLDIWDLRFNAVGVPSASRVSPIAGDPVRRATAAAMSGDRIAVAIQHLASVDELVVLDVAAGSVLARGPLEESLAPGSFAATWLAFDGVRIVSSVALSAGNRVRIRQIEGGAFATISDTTTTTFSYPARGAIEVARSDALVRSALEAAQGVGVVENMPLVPPNPIVDIDGPHVFDLGSSITMRIDGTDIGDYMWGALYGGPTFAVDERWTIGLATNAGVVWTSEPASMALRWQTTTNMSDGGTQSWATSYGSPRDHGIFFLEAPGTSGTLRYVGDHCAP